MDPAAILLVLLALAALAFGLWRQFSTRPVDAKTLLRMPLLLGALGLVQLARGGTALDEGSLALLGVELLVGAALGVGRAFTMRLWRDPSGAVLSKGTALTAVGWIVSVAVRILLSVGAARIHVAAAPTGPALLLAVGATFGAQGIALAWRAKGVEKGVAGPEGAPTG